MTKKGKRVLSREFKLSVLERLAAGENARAPSRELGVLRKCLYQWRERYRLGSAIALRSRGRMTKAEALAMPAGPARRLVARRCALRPFGFPALERCRPPRRLFRVPLCPKPGRSGAGRRAARSVSGAVRAGHAVTSAGLDYAAVGAVETRSCSTNSVACSSLQRAPSAAQASISAAGSCAVRRRASSSRTPCSVGCRISPVRAYSASTKPIRRAASPLLPPSAASKAHDSKHNRRKYPPSWRTSDKTSIA